MSGGISAGAVRLPGWRRGEGRTVEVMEVRLFGELEAVAAGVPVPVRGAKQRALLALLALRRGQPASADRLIDELWGESPPAGARQTLRAYVSKLRRAMGANGASSTMPGESNGALGDGVDRASRGIQSRQQRRVTLPGDFGDEDVANARAFERRRRL